MAETILDRFIGYLSPVAGKRRALARAMIGAVHNAQMTYDAARPGRRTEGWRAVNTDANAEIGAASQRLRNVARDMVRNNPHASRAVQVISEGVVGSGIIPNVVCADEKQRMKILDLIIEHCDTTSIDVDGRHNLYGIQNLAMRAVAEAGEVFIRHRQRLMSDGLPMPFQLQVIEADHLNRQIDGPLPSGGYAIQGIEFNAKGRRVAYHLYREHPGSVKSYRLPETLRVPADTVAHIYRVDRPGQITGVTWFAPVIVRLRDYADYADAQLLRQKISACFAAFIKRDNNAGSPFASQTEKSSATDLPLESIEPGMIEHLAPGEEVQFGMPPTVEGFSDYTVTTMQEISVGLGLDYASLTGDNSRGNFANGRMGWLRFHRSIESWQSNMLIPAGLDPIGKWILDAAAVVTGRRIPAKVMWTPPRREMFDPAKDIEASDKAIAAGLSSRPYEQRRLGFDPEDLDQEIADSNARADKLGLKFTSDGRMRMKTPTKANEGTSDDA